MTLALAHPLLSRLGEALIHALWILALPPAAAWLGLVVLRRRSASVRYLWAMGCLGAMVAGFVLLLGRAFPGGSTPEVVQALGGGTLPRPMDLTGSPVPAGFMEHLSPLLPWLSLLWMAGSLLQALRLGGALWRLEQVFLAKSEPAPQAWQSRLDHLAARLGLRRAIRLRLSAGVDSPLALGWLKPVILLPPSALLGLTPESLEAVLLHELAHVRRLDYLANLLQCAAEALLFFHPALWWLTRRIRELREHCCDDLAAATCGDPVLLAEGLHALERLRRTSHHALEPALAAGKGPLMSRMLRILRPEAAPMPSFRSLLPFLAGAGLLASTSLHVAPPAPPPVPPAPRTVPAAPAPPQAPEAPAAPALPADTPDAPPPPPPPPPTPAAPAAPLCPNAATLEILAKPLDGKVQEAVDSRPSAAWVQQVFAGVPAMPAILAKQPIPPPYPLAARQEGEQGLVVVALVIGPDGTPEKVTPFGGPASLVAAASQHATQWRFQSPLKDGKPTRGQMLLYYVFKLVSE